jgi:hypothetical protein
MVKREHNSVSAEAQNSLEKVQVRHNGAHKAALLAVLFLSLISLTISVVSILDSKQPSGNGSALDTALGDCLERISALEAQQGNMSHSISSRLDIVNSRLSRVEVLQCNFSYSSFVRCASEAGTLTRTCHNKPLVSYALQVNGGNEIRPIHRFEEWNSIRIETSNYTVAHCITLHSTCCV